MNTLEEKQLFVQLYFQHTDKHRTQWGELLKAYNAHVIQHAEVSSDLKMRLKNLAQLQAYAKTLLHSMAAVETERCTAPLQLTLGHVAPQERILQPWANINLAQSPARPSAGPGLGRNAPRQCPRCQVPLLGHQCIPYQVTQGKSIAWLKSSSTFKDKVKPAHETMTVEAATKALQKALKRSEIDKKKPCKNRA